MPKRQRQFDKRISNLGIIDSQLHYGVWSRVWWEEVDIELETGTKHFIIPYRLYMRIECDINSKTFIITVLTDVQNSLKPGFQYICDEVKSNFESSLSKAINICYQQIFKTKTEYSGLAVIGFDSENIIQQLIADVIFFPIFLRIDNKFNVVISNIGDLDENRFYGV
ncbi:7447_t:CDS:1, partial [Cetraspora pellucida]